MSGIPSWAVRGAKVVCIEADWIPDEQPLMPPRLPCLHEVLTIADIVDVGDCWLAFDEIAGDWFFHVDSFRPLVTRSQEQDIAEHFEHHLRAPVRETAEVQP